MVGMATRCETGRGGHQCLTKFCKEALAKGKNGRPRNEVSNLLIFVQTISKWEADVNVPVSENRGNDVLL